MDPVDRTRRTYDAVAETYHERTGDIDALLPAMDRLVDALPDHPRVLDAGCGPGRDADWLTERGARVVGVDFAGGQLRLATLEAPDALLVQGDLRSLPLRDDSVDGVWAVASLIHVPDESLDDALTELHRVCRPGGTLFTSMKPGAEGAMEHTYGYDTDTGRLFVFHEPEPFADRLRDAGFTVESVEPEPAWFRVWARA
ncbi:class I SAM-dependent methyltransferase [Halorarius litoreus]|uniref:class I SAM-dependent methyltransferase n=1 Tax=Halorarius litoreus TaxID=2962676 RepID=UPI0020CD13DA|nr:class I SAM-dependent methyltransferase [Halorarius litoreus]